MALIKTGSAAVAISGKIGGIVYQRNGRARAWAPPMNPNTALQAASRSAFTWVSQQWGILDALEQNAWDDYAAANPVPNRLGEMKAISGKAYFSKINVERQKAGLALLADAPSMTPSVPVFPMDPAEYGITFEAQSVIIALTGNAPLPATDTLLVYASRPQSANATPTMRGEFLAKVQAGAATPVEDVTFDLPFMPVAGEAIKFRIVRLGVARQEMFTTAIVV